ncbi:DUF4435 domain-containing protein [Sorangium sp. So ce185]|uniref:hypothetical protein n=1 Tax=Sorangium sp. So ce185 TaxID=3133287 RepID=UPI003F61F763
MSSYSLSGYISVLETRTSSTLIVEGINDKKIVAGLIRRFETLGILRARKLVVDTAEMISGSTGVCGNRAIVETVHAQATRLGIDLFAFVDREFREFVFGPPVIDAVGGHYVAAPNLIWTRGHSAENYAFHRATVEAFLSRIVPEHVDSEMSDRAVAAVPSIMRWLAALSISLARGHVVTRCNKMLSMASWEVDTSGCLALNVNAVRAQMVARCVSGTEADVIVNDVQIFERDMQQNATDVSRWVSHGHVGSDGLWSGVAKVLLAVGLSSNVAQEIATAHRDTKLRIGAEIWGDQVKSGDVKMPQNFIDWLKQ